MARKGDGQFGGRGAILKWRQGNLPEEAFKDLEPRIWGPRAEGAGAASGLPRGNGLKVARQQGDQPGSCRRSPSRKPGHAGGGGSGGRSHWIRHRVSRWTHGL